MWKGIKQDWAYYGFQFKDIKKQEYRHLFLFLFWPVYIVLFFLIETLAANNGYTVIHCALDDKIPFNEWFIIPYVIWYPFWILMVLYSAGFEVPVFKKLMTYLIVTLSISLLIYAIWPNGQDMWPEKFPRDNFLTWLTRAIYNLDHNTNVCPSEHVTSGFGVAFAAMASKRFRKSRTAMVLIWLEAILVPVSVVFVKQHSILDVFAAIPLTLFGYYVAFCPHKKRKKV